MAATDLGARLTEQHRQAQVANQQTFLAEFLNLWPLLNVFDLDESAPGWVQAVLRLIEAFREQSAELAVDYYHRYREIEAPEAPELPPVEVGARPETIRAERRVARGNRGVSRARDDTIRLDWRDADRAARTSMIVTGPVNIKAKVKRAQPVEQASRAALVEAAGAAGRHVLTGGRQSLLRVIEGDEGLELRGYIRVTDDDPCYFCAMLASRGPVFPSKWAAGGSNRRGSRNARAGVEFVGDGSFKVHDHCACTVEPVYYTDTVWPGRGAEFRQLWRDHIEDQYSGKNAIRAWRRLYEKRQRDLEQELAA